MKDKDLRRLNLSEVIEEIQGFLESESRRSDTAQIGSWLEEMTPGMSSTRQSKLPASLTATQFYLSRHKGSDGDLLQTLPTDMFIVC